MTPVLHVTLPNRPEGIQFYTAALQKTHFNGIPRSLWDAITALFSHQFWYLVWAAALLSNFNNHSFISETQTMVKCAICLSEK